MKEELSDKERFDLGRKVTCDSCGSKDGEVRLNPFMLDMYNEKVPVNICEICNEDLIGDI